MPSAPPIPLPSATWEAWSTAIVLRLTDAAALCAARAAVERELAAIDQACSRFREDSELSRVNARAGSAVRVSTLLIDALEFALGAAELTAGDVDPTVGRALELCGYDRDWRELRDAGGAQLKAPIITARKRPGWRAVRVDRAGGTIRLPAGARIDLGATAKAWAADRAARAAADAGGCGALVGVGGDIATCGSPPAGGWLVRVTDDHRSDPSAPGQTVSIRDGGLATSSTAVRRWRRAGASMHHIIDPRTCAPVRATWRTVSVAAADCTQANIATTAALVRAGAAPKWLESLGLPARLVAWDGGTVLLGGWPAPASRCAAVPGQSAWREAGEAA